MNGVAVISTPISGILPLVAAAADLAHAIRFPTPEATKRFSSPRYRDTGRKLAQTGLSCAAYLIPVPGSNVRKVALSIAFRLRNGHVQPLQNVVLPDGSKGSRKNWGYCTEAGWSRIRFRCVLHSLAQNVTALRVDVRQSLAYVG